MKKTILLFIAASMLIFSVSCGSGGSGKAQITSVGISETQTLNIQCTAGSDISADEGSIRVSVSHDEGNVRGTVYCLMELKNDLEKGKSYLFLFDMSQERSWTVGKGGLNIGGASVAKELKTADILSLFGDDAAVSVSFLINDTAVSEKELEK